MPAERRISTSRGTLGAERIAGHGCYLCGAEWVPTHVRFNLDGIWTVLCDECRLAAIDVLSEPSPAREHTR